MVDVGYFTAAIQLAVVINDIARAAQANKVSCMAMNSRIQIANEIIKTAFERHKASPKSIVIAENAFQLYFQLLERMRDFIAGISKKKTFSKLNLGIALRTQAQLENDRNAIEEDMVELRQFRKELQNGLDSLGGQLVGIRQMIATNQPMDDILASVEVDFRQVLDITPSETRQGRTFPVHKRSWLGQEVAEKPLGHFGSQDMLNMLKGEVAILKKLDRCNYITKFMGVTNRNNNISIIMEWLPNGDLASTLAKDELDWEQKLFIAADIARGLMFLHEVGIIHKTLRAKNILLTRFNQAKITNFRQSRMESAQSRPMSDPFSFVRWLAPEKMRPEGARYGTECDIYSFGMLLFEIASNQIPFKTYSDRELPELIVNKSYYEKVPTSTPKDYADIMTACWLHEPRMRPTTSQVLLILREACRAYEGGEETFGGLPTSMASPGPLFAVSPASPMVSNASLVSPPSTPNDKLQSLLSPMDAWNNPYVNRQYVEEMAQKQQQQQPQPQPMGPTSNAGPQPQNPPAAQQPMQQQQQKQLSQGQAQTSLQTPPASKEEYGNPTAGMLSPNSLPRTSRPQQPQNQSQNQQQSNGTNSPTPTPLIPLQISSPRQSQLSVPGNAVASASATAVAMVGVSMIPDDGPMPTGPPIVNRNTRPLTVKSKRATQSLENDMNRLSMNDASNSRPETNGHLSATQSHVRTSSDGSNGVSPRISQQQRQ
ncbi:hypothetical protein BGW38_008582, partial [Lunasporangiospora selenospora]